MKNIILFLVLLVGCSQQNSSNNVSPDLVEFEATDEVLEGSGNYGDLTDTTKILTFSIKNTGLTPLVGPAMLEDSSNFEIIYQPSSCNNVLPTKTCSIKVAFDAKGKSAGPYTTKLNLDRVFVSLSANVLAPVTETSVEFRIGSTVITSQNFGNLQGTQSVQKTIYIKNTSSKAQNLPASISTPDFNFIYDSCSNKNVGAGASCLVKINFSAEGKSGPISSSLMYGTSSLPLTATVNSSDMGNVEYASESIIVESINYGDVTPGTSILKTVVIKNTGLAPVNFPVNLTGSGYVKIYDMCSNRNIAPQGKCIVKINYLIPPTPGENLGNLSYNGIDLPLLSNVVVENIEAPANKIALTNFNPSTGIVNFGDVEQNDGDTAVKSITIRNLSGAIQKFTIPPVINNYTVVSNSCFNVNINRSNYCTISFKFNSDGKDIQNYDETFLMENDSTKIEFQLKANVIANSGIVLCNMANAPLAGVDNTNLKILEVEGVFPLCTVKTCEALYSPSLDLKSCQGNVVACTSVDAMANGVNLTEINTLLVPQILGDVVAGDVSQCLINGCNYGFAKAVDGKSCQAESLACTPSDVQNNGWNISSALTYEGNRTGNDVSLCAIDSCLDNYEISGKACSPISCNVGNANIDFAQTVSGDLVAGCTLDTCISEYTKIGNSCSPTMCTLDNASGNGLTSILEVASVSGTINNDSCIVDSCNMFYQKAGDNKSCLAKECSQLNGDELLALNINTSGATISGTYPSCDLTCNPGFFEVNGQCLPDLITYQPTYSSYGSCSVDTACEGMGTESRTIVSCQKYNNGVAIDGAILSDCNSYNISANLNQSCSSPEGTLILNITGGTKTVFCAAGSSVQQTQSVSCTGEYVAKNGACVIPQLAVNSYKGFSGGVSKSFPLDDGSVIYTGDFTSFVDKDGVSHVANRIIKINSDGSVNTTFKTNIGTGFNATPIEGVLDSTQSHIFLIGNFTQVNGISRGKVAKISVDGVVNTTFNTNTGTACNSNCTPYFIDRDSNNNVYLSGSFQYFNGAYMLSPITNYANVIKLSPDGVRDTAFQTAVGYVTEAETVNTRTYVNKNNNHVIMTYCSAASACGLLKFSTAGARDATFKTNVGTFTGGNVIFELVFDASNNIYVMGNITQAKGVTSRYLVKYSATGVFNTAFNTAMVSLNMDYYPRTLAFDGTYLYLSGSINTVTGGIAKRLLRVNTNGVWDSAFNVATGTNDTFATFSPYAEDITFDSQGNIIIVGDFNFFNGKSANNQVKLNPSGQTISNISSGAELNGIINQIAQDSQGNFYVVGNFNCYGASPCSTSNGIGIDLGGIIKFNPDMSMNIEFLKNIGTSANSSVYTIALDSNDNIYIGGVFSQIGSVANNARGLAKLSPAGVFNTSFSNAMDVTPGTKSATTSGFSGGNVNSIVIDASNNLYVGGSFTQYKNTFNNAKSLAKLSSSGVLDTSFSNAMDVAPPTKSATTSGFNGAINTLTLDGQGNLYAGGAFTSYKGVSNSARYLAKLSTTGVLDSTFQTNYGNSSTTAGLNNTVRAIAIHSLGDVFVGGDFTNYNGVTAGAMRIAKFSSSGVIDSSFMNKLDVSPPTKSFTTSGLSGTVSSILIDNDDVIIAGGFTAFKGVANSAMRIIKLDIEGNQDTSFQSNIGTGFNNQVNTIMMGQDYQLYLGGYFTTYQGLNRKYLMTISPEGLE